MHYGYHQIVIQSDRTITRELFILAAVLFLPLASIGQYSPQAAYGVTGAVRTRDQLIFSQPLYLLSYRDIWHPWGT